MFDSALVDVAIGLSLVFLLFSLLVTAATEMFAGALKWRSTHLWNGIETLLQSPEHRTRLYQHSLVRGLATSLKLTEEVGRETGMLARPGSKGPSYIPSKTFALALLDVIREPHQAADSLMGRIKAFDAKLKTDPCAALTDLDEGITGLLASAGLPDPLKRKLASAQAFCKRLDDATVKPLLEQVNSVLSEAQDAAVKADLQQWIARASTATGIELREEMQTIVGRIAQDAANHRTRALLSEIARGIAKSDPQELRTAVSDVSNSLTAATIAQIGGPLRQSLGALMSDAASDVDRFRENIEVWFNDGMDRVTGAYKRHSMGWQFGIAALLAIALNVDALLIVRALWREPTLRRAIANEGAMVAEGPPPSVPRRATAFQSETGSPQLKVEVSSPTIVAGEPQTAYVSLVPTPEQDVEITARAESAHVKVRRDNSGEAKTQDTITIPKGKDKQPVYLVADSVTTESLERVLVTAGNAAAALEVVVVPPADRRFENVQAQISGLGLPIGWSCGSDEGVAPRDSAGGPRARVTSETLPVWCGEGALGASGIWWLLSYLAVPLGWLITAGAASLGSPFWFDLLKRVVSIRSAGKAPEERPLPPKEVSQPREPGQRPADADLARAVAR